jgi:hypothetical protein
MFQSKNSELGSSLFDNFVATFFKACSVALAFRACLSLVHHLTDFQLILFLSHFCIKKALTLG